MGDKGYLIDSNVIIDYLGSRIPFSGMQFMHQVIDDEPKISIISEIEILGFNSNAKNEQLLKNFMEDVIILRLDESITEICIELRKKYKIKIPDAIIASTAIIHDLILLTRNISDFKKITELRMADPHKIEIK